MVTVSSRLPSMQYRLSSKHTIAVKHCSRNLHGPIGDQHRCSCKTTSTAATKSRRTCWCRSPEFSCSSVGELVLALVQGLAATGAIVVTPPGPGSKPGEDVGRGVPGPVLGSSPGGVTTWIVFSSRSLLTRTVALPTSPQLSVTTTSKTYSPCLDN